MTYTCRIIQMNDRRRLTGPDAVATGSTKMGVGVPDEQQELDRLAGQLFQGMLKAEAVPGVVASLASWLRPGIAAEAATCPLARGDAAGQQACPGEGGAAKDERCSICVLLDSERPNWQRIVDFYIRCRALREFSDHAASWAQTSHVAAIIVTPDGYLLDCDNRGQSFLKAGEVLRLNGSELCCADTAFQPQFAAALKETASTARSKNILLRPPGQPDKRFSLTLTRMLQRPSEAGDPGIPDILCLVAPLDGRRIATARQLMDFFGLSAAEARLARAICHGDSVEEYARDQGLRLPTVRTQLSAIFNKTGTDRQAMLVRLIAGIPVVRDAG